jgi:hypothetical protein
VTLFTDIIYSEIPSRQDKNAAQILCTAAGWTQAYPMQNEKDEHHALSLLFKQEVMPNAMVVDGEKLRSRASSGASAQSLIIM